MKSQLCSSKKLYFDDFNAWMIQQNSGDANEFRSILNNFGLKNHVKNPTHNLGHTLDLVIDYLENLIIFIVNGKPQNTTSDLMVKKLLSFYRCYSKKKQCGDLFPHLQISRWD